MEEKRNYVVYTNEGYNEEIERVVKITESQAKAIDWFMENFDIDGCVELAEKYEGEEI